MPGPKGYKDVIFVSSTILLSQYIRIPVAVFNHGEHFEMITFEYGCLLYLLQYTLVTGGGGDNFVGNPYRSDTFKFTVH